MAKGMEFFDVHSFFKRIGSGELKSRSAALAAYRTAALFAFTTKTYVDTRVKHAQDKGMDPLLGPRQMVLWCNELLRKMNIEVFVEGAYPIASTLAQSRQEKPRGTLLICNHRTYLDIAVVGSLLPTFMVGNAAVSKWPVFGYGGTMVGILYLDRSSAESRQMIRDVVLEKLNAGYCVLNFPEGADFAGPGMAPFKPGMFHVVAGLDVDIVPMTLRYPPEAGVEWVGDNPEEMASGGVGHGGSRVSFIEHVIDIMAGSPVKVSAYFGEPIDCSQHTDVPALITLVREKMLKDLERSVPWENGQRVAQSA